LDQIKLVVPLNLEEELYLMDGDMANGWGTEKSFAQVLKFFMDERRGGTLQGRSMLMKMNTSSSMLGDNFLQPGCVFAQGKPPKRMGIETFAFAIDGPDAPPPRKDMCYIQTRAEFDSHNSTSKRISSSWNGRPHTDSISLPIHSRSGTGLSSLPSSRARSTKMGRVPGYGGNPI
jgi:hypothetical protein